MLQFARHLRKHCNVKFNNWTVSLMFWLSIKNSIHYNLLLDVTVSCNTKLNAQIRNRFQNNKFQTDYDIVVHFQSNRCADPPNIFLLLVSTRRITILILGISRELRITCLWQNCLMEFDLHWLNLSATKACVYLICNKINFILTKICNQYYSRLNIKTLFTPC